LVFFSFFTLKHNMLMLPTMLLPPTEVNPKILILAGREGVGKTRALSLLGNRHQGELCIIADTEKGTEKNWGLRVHLLDITNYNERETPEQAAARKAKPVPEYYLDEFLREVYKLNQQVRQQSGGRQQFFYKYGVFDTLSRLDEWSEISATLNYMSTNQGKNFNREVLRDGTPVTLRPTDPSFETVHMLKEGYGYRYSRKEMIKWCLEVIPTLFEYVVYAAHIEVNRNTEKDGLQEVKTRYIDVTGQLKKILARRADTVGFLFREDNKVMVTFEGSDETSVKNRCDHLSDKTLVLSERRPDGTITANWDQIYLEKPAMPEAQPIPPAPWMKEAQAAVSTLKEEPLVKPEPEKGNGAAQPRPARAL
jgi:hypothetical protein